MPAMVDQKQESESASFPHESLSDTKKEEFYETKRDLARIVEVFNQIGFRDFVNYLSSPGRIIWRNLIAGIFRGLGILIGLTVVIGILVWLFTIFIDIPLLGQYFQQLIDVLEGLSSAQLRPY